MQRTFGAIAVAATLVLGGMAAGCAKKINMSRSAAVPSVEARLKVDKKEDNQKQIKVSVQHLAPVERLSPDAKHYVVWLQAKDAQAMPSNIGVLALDDDQEAELETSTPFERFDVFVTAEEDAQATTPRGERVLWATVD